MTEYELKDKYVEYSRGDNYVIIDIIEEKEYQLNKTAQTIYKNINREAEVIILELNDMFDSLPDNLVEIVEKFRTELIEKFFKVHEEGNDE